MSILSNEKVSREVLFSNAKTAAANLDAARLNAKNVTYADGLDASAALSNALTALNNDMLSSLFDSYLETGVPVEALCKAHFWSRWYAKTNKKDNATTLETRRTRLDLYALLDYAKEIEKPIPQDNAIRTAIAMTAHKVSDYVLSTLTRENAMSIQEPKKALAALIELLNLDGVKARSVDMRWIVYAVTKARDLGELAAINEKSIVPYLMDVLYVQMTGKTYQFEEKKAEEEKA